VAVMSAPVKSSFPKRNLYHDQGAMEMSEQEKRTRKPGVCVPWEERLKEYPKIMGDEKIVQKVWEETDMLAYLYIWFCLTLF